MHTRAFDERQMMVHVCNGTAKEIAIPAGFYGLAINLDYVVSLTQGHSGVQIILCRYTPTTANTEMDSVWKIKGDEELCLERNNRFLIDCEIYGSIHVSLLQRRYSQRLHTETAKDTYQRHFHFQQREPHPNTCSAISAYD